MRIDRDRISDDAPVAGDAERWEALFAAAFADDPRVAHHTFAWDRTDDVRGAVETEFATRGYDVELSVGMIARADEIHSHPRANADVEVRALDPEWGGADERRWQQVLVPWAKDWHERDPRRLYAAKTGWAYINADGPQYDITSAARGPRG